MQALPLCSCFPSFKLQLCPCHVCPAWPRLVVYPALHAAAGCKAPPYPAPPAGKIDTAHSPSPSPSVAGLKSPSELFLSSTMLLPTNTKPTSASAHACMQGQPNTAGHSTAQQKKQTTSCCSAVKLGDMRAHAHAEGTQTATCKAKIRAAHLQRMKHQGGVLCPGASARSMPTLLTMQLCNCHRPGWEVLP